MFMSLIFLMNTKLRFHDVMVKYLDAKSGDRILEVGCGFGEAGRQVALRSGAKVTGHAGEGRGGGGRAVGNVGSISVG